MITGRCVLEVVKALGALKLPQVIPILAPLLTEPTGMCVPAAARALGQVQDPQIVPLLAPLVADGAWSVRQAAMKPLRFARQTLAAGQPPPQTHLGACL